MIGHVKNKLSFAYWNIDGAFNRIANQRVCKLTNGDVQNTLCKNDIVCLVETHCGEGDILDLPGYKAYSKIRDRSVKAKRNYGGITVCIKNEILNGIKVLPSSSSEIMWIQLCRTFFNLKNDIFLATVYVSPASSPYSKLSEDIFEILEDDIARYSMLGQCIVCGDFNARTACDLDFCTDDISTNTEIHDSLVAVDNELGRFNTDTHVVDKHGKFLLELCKSTGLRILNGRTIGDIQGNFTCYSHSGSPSAIDYVLATVNMLNTVDTFFVHEPGPHSIHCILSTIIATGSYSPPPTNNLSFNKTCPSFIWRQGDDGRFLDALQRSDIQGRIIGLVNHSLDSSSAVENLNEILIDAAKIAGIRQKSVKKQSRVSNHKPTRKRWFDSDCKTLKSQLASLSKKLRQQPYNMALLIEFRTLRKRYKSCINKKKTVFKQDILNQMESMHSNNPREYWSLFDKLRDLDCNGKSNNPISNADWVKHFSQLLNDTSKGIQSSLLDTMEDFITGHKDKVFNELDFLLTTEEVSKAISRLKCGKSAGFDLILSEMLKAGHTVLLPVLVKVFNTIFSAGCFPDSWRCNILQPLHKKGDKNIPSNYRGIAVGSHLSKLFCSILHNRLYNFSEAHSLVPDCQIGFKRDARTADHILTLKCIVDKFVNKSSKEYLFCCFVDFKAAFDSIPRKALIFKLVKLGIGGKFIAMLQNVYKEVFYSVKADDRYSDNIASNLGVKQGCVLSPLLFNLYLHDLPCIFNDCDPVNLQDSEISCLLYADDLVIVSKSHSGLQRALDKLSNYCQKWGLYVNLEKTKVIIFNKSGRVITRYTFSYRGTILESVQSYCYLGILFTVSGNFRQACDRLAEQASRALFKLKTINVRDNVSVAYRLFDSLILPILRYCSEVWCPFLVVGLNDINFMNICDATPIEKIMIKYGKYLLGCNKRTSNTAVRGELGQYPLLCTLLPHAVKYWLSLCTGDKSSLRWKAYLDSYNSSNRSPNWSQCIRILLSQFKYDSVWDNQDATYINHTVKHFRKTLRLNYDTHWLQFINDSDKNPKLRTFKLFKTGFQMENYILYEPNVEKRRQFSKLRLSAHSLQIERGRYCWPKIAPECRTCLLCQDGSVEDEKHFIMKCGAFETDRAQFFSKLSECSIFDELDEDAQFKFIMSCNNGDTDVMKLSLPYVNNITTTRNTLLIK